MGRTAILDGFLQSDLDARGHRILNLRPSFVTHVGSDGMPPLFRTFVCNPSNRAELHFLPMNVANGTFYGNVSGGIGPPSFQNIDKLITKDIAEGITQDISGQVINNVINQYNLSTLPGVVAPAQGGLPAGGDAGDFLGKVSGTDYDAAWVSASEVAHALPPGGSIRDVLAKRSVEDYDAGWTDSPAIAKLPNLTTRGAVQVTGDGTLVSGPNWAEVFQTTNPQTTNVTQAASGGVFLSISASLTMKASGIIFGVFVAEVSANNAGQQVFTVLCWGSTPTPAGGTLWNARPSGWNTFGQWNGMWAAYANQNMHGSNFGLAGPFAVGQQIWFTVVFGVLAAGNTCTVGNSELIVFEL